MPPGITSFATAFRSAARSAETVSPGGTRQLPRDPGREEEPRLGDEAVDGEPFGPERLLDLGEVDPGR